MSQLTNINFIKDLFRHYQLKPKDYFGQNFLVDEIALDDIVTAANLKKTDTVLEVGPGLGVLTQQLAARAGKIIAVEKDVSLLDILKLNIKEFKNIDLYNKDILRFDISKQIKDPYKVVANIPYYLTSKLISTLLALPNKPELIVMLIQKEVGERIVAGPGEQSLLSLSVQFYANPEIISHVSKECFWPSPDVDSVIIKITPKNKFPEILDEKVFFRILKWAFAGKRKQLSNTISTGLKLKKEEANKLLTKAGITPDLRPQAVTLEQWVKLYKLVKSGL